MWRIYRKTIFPRWHANRQNPVESPKGSANERFKVSPYSQKHSNENSEERQRADYKKFWDDPQFHFHAFGASVLETAGWLGAAVAVCLNIHSKNINAIYERDKLTSLCIFQRRAYGMPLHSNKKECPILNHPNTNNSSQVLEIKKKSSLEHLESLGHMMNQHAIALQNSAGIASLTKNAKKAFHHFQRAARLGSSEGFYNLGLCYEFGKGTRINLNRAAFCYRKATAQGHGLAAFNLAVYFSKGIGGLPVDENVAKVLFAQAADKGVPEAQMYIGVDHLDNERWSDAFAIFTSLAEKNVLDGKYYLGICYENGYGVERNEKTAAELFSEIACLGHQRATLRLGSYFEEGKGGCDNNLDFAKALYQILIDQGCKEAEKALLKIKLKEKNIALKEKLKVNPKRNVQKYPMHCSLSVPELASSHSSNELLHHVSTSPYLDLITPDNVVRNNKEVLNNELQKATFYLDDSEEATVPFIHAIHNIPQVMVAKT